MKKLPSFELDSIIKPERKSKERGMKKNEKKLECLAYGLRNTKLAQRIRQDTQISQSYILASISFLAKIIQKCLFNHFTSSDFNCSCASTLDNM